jgi:hypothetical protein
VPSGLVDARVRSGTARPQHLFSHAEIAARSPHGVLRAAMCILDALPERLGGTMQLLLELLELLVALVQR